MATSISNLSYVDPQAEIGEDVTIGPFCFVGPDVKIGNGTVLDSHVSITGHTTIGERNRFFPTSVIGSEPQDAGYHGAPTRLIIGDDNLFREGCTIHRGAEKEDHCTRIGNRNTFLCNSHVAHNCRIFDDVTLVNGVLLGGHVHVHDRAIVSGNTVVHQFCTVGTLAFVSGGARATIDVPPFMICTGSDDFRVRFVNLVGMQRAGISESSIAVIRKAYRLFYRKNKKLDEVREIFSQELEGVMPMALQTLFNHFEGIQGSKAGRGREAAARSAKYVPEENSQDSTRRAA
ncbi:MULTISPECIES: acyl-ACP--UDP-N-acetylglucosamine O-acyltransferase [Gimesia]|jgi:UDP-N-acetylglucosamine acyltransferase|uniref:Acyl-ACP--UDP-N-acetylglucosamine O-acyltransferase n=2 Tax=Gimesia TaxID=1649453 RepID=A0A6I6ACT0_9PLAN|nr:MULTISPECIES: acyl-ACP--UDP-N-acetylglucosamine O-acyltransferase [Gimesia]QDT18870.1 Acyl-[acyl-carrier-protein]--UDP-N-acetylglucosamine O-acyltransferase [Gimesia chilikensis]QDT82987.1 Acyl-[acyl-carrier-protein]--UDP-N-acetylglucosamine O-acyltransferase [Gimesia chilikensis]QGQ23195.1 acyl-ACP--UDP-N-acetylglucosamine O-acyltransferase [Gimesia benthica]